MKEQIEKLKDEFRIKTGVDVTDHEISGKFPAFNSKLQKWGSISRGEGWKRYAEFLEKRIAALEKQTGEFYVFWQPETKEYGEVLYNHNRRRYEVFADPDEGSEPHVFGRELMDDYVKAKLIMNGFEIRPSTLVIHDKEQKGNGSTRAK